MWHRGGQSNAQNPPSYSLPSCKTKSWTKNLGYQFRIHVRTFWCSYLVGRVLEKTIQGNVYIPFQILLIWSPSQAPCQFDDELVLRQLRYTGMVETVKIRKAGYSVRMTFEVCALTKKYGNVVNMCNGSRHICTLMTADLPHCVKDSWPAHCIKGQLRYLTLKTADLPHIKDSWPVTSSH